MAVNFKIVDIDKARHEDAAEVAITTKLVLDALDVWAPEDGERDRSQALGRYEVVAAPPDDANEAVVQGGATPGRSTS